MRHIFFLVLGLVFFTGFCLLLDVSQDSSAATITVDDDGNGDFTVIQEAVDSASTGDVILVYEGTYSEELIVNKTVTIQGNGTINTTIQSPDPNKNAVSIQADHVNFSGFQVREGSAGILITSANNTITEINCTENKNGILVWITQNNTIMNSAFYGNSDRGIFFWESAHNSITTSTFTKNADSGVTVWRSNNISLLNNNLTESDIGVYNFNSENITIEGSYLSDLTGGISLLNCQYSEMRNNSFVNCGIQITGDSLIYWKTHTISTTNTLNNNPIYYFSGVSGITVPGGAGMVIITDSTDMIVEGQNCVNGSVGLYISFSFSVEVLNSSFSSNSERGIFITNSNKIEIINCTISENLGDGLDFRSSHNNSVKESTITNNLNFGIYLVKDCNDNVVNNNSIMFNAIGIRFDKSSKNNDVHFNDIENNTQEAINAIFNEGSIVNATENWYGDVSGPYQPSLNPEGIGDNVTEFALFDPWIGRGIIVDISPDPALRNSDVTFMGEGYMKKELVRYVWRSSIDGEFYYGIDDTIEYSGLSNGTHTIYFKAQDSTGLWTYEVNTTQVINGKPVVSIEYITPNPGLDVETIHFRSNATDDGTVIRYVWDSDLDGNIYNGTVRAFNFNGLSNGTHIISIIVQDNLGFWSETKEFEVVINGKPVSNIDAVSPNPSLDIQTIEFEGHGTDDGSIIRYAWDSSIDGEFYNDTATKISSSGLSNGTHTISFQVQDNDNIWSSVDIMTLVIDGKPLAHIEFITPSPALDVDEVEFKGHGSDDGTIENHSWRSDLDGEFYNGTASGSVKYSDLSNGTHTISFKVQDDFGTWSDEVGTILVINGKPLAFIDSITPNPALDIQTVGFEGHGTDDGTISRYAWRSDVDGEFYNDTESTFLFTDLTNGTHTIFLKVQDNSGTWSDEVNTIQVINGKPLAHIDTIQPNPGLDVEDIEFTGQGSDDGVITQYAWRSDVDGEFIVTPDSTIMFGDLTNGTHTISLKVQDDFGIWSDEVNATLVINGKPLAFIDSITPIPALDIDTVNFSYHGSDDGSVENYSWRSDLDGIFYNGTNSTFTYHGLSNGTHTLLLKVQDDFGTWSDDVNTTLVINGKPLAWIDSVSPNPALDIEVVDFSGDGSDDGTIVRYMWRSDLDGIFYNGTNSTFTYHGLSNGTHTLFLKVQDDFGTWSDEVNTTLTINGKPLAWIDSVSPNPALDIETIEFTGNGSDDGTIVRYMWRSDLDGIFYNGTNSTFSFPGLSNGTHTIFLKVQDDFGTWSDEVNSTLVINGKPVAWIDSISPSPALDIETIEFSGSGSDDGTIVRYIWRSDVDGVFYNGTNTTFTQHGLSNGTHTLFLKVQDDFGTWSDEVNTTLFINGKPIVRIDSIIPNPALDVDTIQYTAIGTDDGSISIYTWKADLGNEFYNGTESSFSHHGFSNGTHTITLMVQDDFGTWSSPVTEELVINGKPIAFIDSISPNPVLDIEEVEFMYHGSDDGSITAYVWSSDLDGEFYNGTETSFSYGGLMNSTHNVSLKVLDDSGAWSDEVFSELVVNGKPLAFIDQINPDSALDIDVVMFQGRGTDDGVIVRYLWRSSEDDVIYDGPEPTFSIGTLSNGTHTIYFSVEDDLGTLSDEVTAQIDINGKPISIMNPITPNPAVEIEVVQFDGYGIDDTAIQLYVWSSDLDNEIHNSSDASFSTSDLTIGTHVITFKVQDEDGIWSEEVTEILVIQNKPRAIIDSISHSIALDIETVAFAGSGVSNGSISLYVWVSDRDGEIYNGSNATFSYLGLSNGTHDVSFKLQDDRGFWSDVQHSMLIINGKPMAHIDEILPDPALRSEEVSFKGIGTDDGTIMNMTWFSDLDGEFYTGAFSGRIVKSDLSNGTHTIIFKVQDDLGIWSKEATTNLVINGKPIAEIVSISPNPAFNVEPIELKALGRDDGSITQYFWQSSIDGDLINGTNATMMIPNLTPGNHVITLKVQDDLGIWSEEVNADIIVKVDDVVPAMVVNMSLNNTTVKGIITIQGTASDNLGIALIAYRVKDVTNWLEANGTTSWSFDLDTTKFENGDHVVEIRAFDGVLNSGVSTILIEVQNGDDDDDDDDDFPLMFFMALMIVIIICLAGMFYIVIMKQSDEPSKPGQDPSTSPTPPPSPAESTESADTESTPPAETSEPTDAVSTTPVETTGPANTSETTDSTTLETTDPSDSTPADQPAESTPGDDPGKPADPPKSD